MSRELFDVAEHAIEAAKSKGARQVAARAGHSRSIEVSYRDGNLEKIAESTSRWLGLSLYVDGRYSSHSTSDLRPEVLPAFLDRAVTLTRLLGVDEHRGLADPELYKGQPLGDLGLRDDAYASVTTDQRKQIARACEAASRAAHDRIASVTAGYSDTSSESVRVHSNGMSGAHARTDFWSGANVTMNDADGRKPSEGEWVGTRRFADLEPPAEIGRRATSRASARLGQRQLGSGSMTVVVETARCGVY